MGKRKFQNMDEKISDGLDPRKTKMVVEINGHDSAFNKSLAFKKCC